MPRRRPGGLLPLESRRSTASGTLYGAIDDFDEILRTLTTGEQ